MCDHAKFTELEERVTALEKTVADMRAETKTSLTTINSNIETLSQMMANMDKRLVEEKAKWGEVFRSIVQWTIRVGLAIIAYAAGVNLTKTALASFFN